VIALALVLLLLLAMMTTAVTAQDNGGAATTEEPTSEFDYNIAPTFVFATDEFNPQDLPSLTGINGHAGIASVSIRSGPGTNYPRISFLRKDGWIDIVGWNGWKSGRVCSATFNDDLDMWVQVQFGGDRHGWIARCTLDIKGKIENLPIVSADGQRTLQR
jgi:hypothetical protein